MVKKQKIDRVFFLTVIALLVCGFFVFTSASLGLLAKDKENFSDIAFNQTFFGLFLGTIAMLSLSKVHYRKWRKFALYIFLFSILTAIGVFIPGLGFEHGGARRWISIAGLSFQPAEFLKLGFVIYLATWLSGVKEKIGNIKFGLLPFLLIVAIIASLLLMQPDIGTFLVIATAGFAIFLSAGARWRDIIIVLIIGILGIISIAILKPYAAERIVTFLDPSRDYHRASYQLQQSLIAIGAGGMFGRGFGQSIQKFGFLPEPVGDSVFSVAAEEFGFIGGLFLISLFVFFAFRGLKIARFSPDLFGSLLTTGIIMLIITQSFFNIASMTGVVPMSGLPLLFVSHGGTALFFTLASIGIILNISKYKTYKK